MAKLAIKNSAEKRYLDLGTSRVSVQPTSLSEHVDLTETLLAMLLSDVFVIPMKLWLFQKNSSLGYSFAGETFNHRVTEILPESVLNSKAQVF